MRQHEAALEPRNGVHGHNAGDVSARIWFARDTGYTADPKVQALGDEHGPGGPLAVEEMMALAKLNGNCGSLSVSYATLARRAFITPAKAKAVVADASKAGIIELTDRVPGGFAARLLKWSSWQPKDPTGRERKARYRSRDQTVTSHVTGRAGERAKSPPTVNRELQQKDPPGAPPTESELKLLAWHGGLWGVSTDGKRWGPNQVASARWLLGNVEHSLLRAVLEWAKSHGYWSGRAANINTVRREWPALQGQYEARKGAPSALQSKDAAALDRMLG